MHRTRDPRLRHALTALAVMLALAFAVANANEHPTADADPSPVDAAWERVEAAYQAMMAQRGSADADRRNALYRDVADTAAAFLALASDDDLARVRTATRHAGTFFRVLADWDGALRVWNAALERYQEPSLRVVFHDNRGRALIALERPAEARADAQAMRELARAHDEVRRFAAALAVDLDASAVLAFPELDRQAASRLVAEASGYLVENAAQRDLNLRVMSTLPRLTSALNQPERLELAARLALREAPQGGQLYTRLLEMRGMALIELGRDDEAQDVLHQLRERAANGDRVASRSVSTLQRAIVLRPGNEAPGFALNDVRGQRSVSLADFRGKIVLLDFWATWCGPCRSVMVDHLQPLYQAYRDRGFEVVGIGTPSRDTAEAQAAFAEQHGYHWTKLFDAEREAIRAYMVTGYPTLVLLDRQGRVVTHSAGAGCIPAVRAYLHEQLGPMEPTAGE